MGPGGRVRCDEQERCIGWIDEDEYDEGLDDEDEEGEILVADTD